MLIDLAHNRPIALLPSREADPLATWLQAHPGVEIIARDRAGAYAEGARRGAPHAQQVADRFHLLRNLAEVLRPVFEAHHQTLTGPAPEPSSTSLGEQNRVSVQQVPPPERTPTAQARRAQRIGHYEQSKALAAQGWTVSAIARQLRLNRQTVRRYLRADAFPEKRRPASRLDPYKAELLQRWNAGCRTGTVLLQAIQQQGYRGKATMVFDYVSRLRQAQGLPPRSRAFLPEQVPLADPAAEVLTPRQAVWLVLKRAECLDNDEQIKLAKLSTAQAFGKLTK